MLETILARLDTVRAPTLKNPANTSRAEVTTTVSNEYADHFGHRLSQNGRRIPHSPPQFLFLVHRRKRRNKQVQSQQQQTKPGVLVHQFPHSPLAAIHSKVQQEEGERSLKQKISLSGLRSPPKLRLYTTSSEDRFHATFLPSRHIQFKDLQSWFYTPTHTIGSFQHTCVLLIASLTYRATQPYFHCLQARREGRGDPVVR